MLIADVHVREMAGMEEARQSLRGSVGEFSVALKEARRLTLSAPLSKIPSPPASPTTRGVSVDVRPHISHTVLSVSESYAQPEADGPGPAPAQEEPLLDQTTDAKFGSDSGGVGSAEPQYAQPPTQHIHVRPAGIALHAVQVRLM